MKPVGLRLSCFAVERVVLQMQKLTVGELIEATGGTLLCGDTAQPVCSITTDSRKATPGALFIPLRGENFDGHDYIGAAFEKGAALSLSARPVEPVAGKTIISVEDTSKALADIARFYLKKYRVPVVGITGSVGKTTTKDMIYSVLNQQYNVLKTQGNFNNEIGLPLTVFRLEREQDMAVLEMGMSAFGEIHHLVDIARPDVAVITNIGMSHIENLGSQEGIFQAKMEICDYFTKDHTLIVNGDDKFLWTVRGREAFEVVTFGIENKDCDVVAEAVENLGIDGSRFQVELDGSRYEVCIPTPGVHNIYNALAAICVGRRYGVPMEQIIRGIAQFRLTEMRLSVEQAHGITIINDCYNASPDSIRAALKVLGSVEAARKVAVLGDMLELGEFAKNAHYELGGEVEKNGTDVLLTAGKNAEHLAIGARDAGLEAVYSYKTTEELAEQIKRYVKAGDVVLVKASRGMHFEKICEQIRK